MDLLDLLVGSTATGEATVGREERSNGARADIYSMHGSCLTLRGDESGARQRSICAPHPSFALCAQRDVKKLNAGTQVA
jgi:hypothetical protein